MQENQSKDIIYKIFEFRFILLGNFFDKRINLR